MRAARRGESPCTKVARHRRVSAHTEVRKESCSQGRYSTRAKARQEAARPRRVSKRTYRGAERELLVKARQHMQKAACPRRISARARRCGKGAARKCKTARARRREHEAARPRRVSKRAKARQRDPRLAHGETKKRDGGREKQSARSAEPGLTTLEPAVAKRTICEEPDLNRNSGVRNGSDRTWTLDIGRLPLNLVY